MMSLVPVYGGLDSLVNRWLPLGVRRSLVESLERSTPTIAVSKADLATAFRIADGTLSPLTGFMSASEYQRVLSSRAVLSNGGEYPWTIPISLPVTDAESARLKGHARAILCDASGNVVGQIQISDVFDWPKREMLEAVYGTSRVDHPGAASVLDDPRTTLVGGTIEMLPPAPTPGYGHLVLAPIQTRALIAARGWEAALAFQTRNPLHRAHEYALVYGLEVLTRSGAYAGVVLNPLVGELKSDDVDAATRMQTYLALRDGRLLGRGDADARLWAEAGYELNDVFELVGLDMKMFYGGPAEAIMHAIYRQNHGFSHIVIGRKHADAPYFDGTPIWGDFDAHQIFDDVALRFPGALVTKPVKVGFAAYYDSIGRVDLMENHPDEKPFFISGTKVRDILVSGARPDDRIVRPEIADLLIAAYKSREVSS